MKRILILQNVVAWYRKAVYNGLAEDYDVTVLHSGSPVVEADDNFRELVVDARPLGPFVLQQGVAGVLAKGSFDVVIAMMDPRWLAHVLPVVGRGKRNVRWIFWGPGYGRGRLANRLRDALARRADALLLYSSANVGELVRHGTPREKIFVAPNTLQLPDHGDQSANQKSSLLFMGVFQKRKRIDLLIEAFVQVVHDLPPDVKLEIVGTTPARNFGKFKIDLESVSALQQKVDAAKLGERVIFHGAVWANHRPFFSRAYAYVSPGHAGLSALQSMAYGVPVVTHARASEHPVEFENLHHGVNALLYDADADLPDALLSICNTPGLHQELGANAYHHYSTARTLDLMLQGFRQAIDG